MSFEKFKESVEFVENNVDNFINKISENEIKIKNYQKISKEVIETLTKQYQELEKYKKEVEYYKTHLLENKKYLDISEITEKIETLLKDYDERLNDKLLKDKEMIDKIRKELGVIR